MLHSCVRARLALPVTASVLKQPLQSHPAHPPPPGVRVEACRLPADDPARPLRLRFELTGDLAALRLPGALAQGAPRRVDGLWQHTCFEAFLAAPAVPSGRGSDSAPYVEFNLAPSGAWAIYRFDGYHRTGMRPEPAGVEPRIVASHSREGLVLEAALAWPAPLPRANPQQTSANRPGTATPATGPWRGRLGLTAVVEAADGSLSYWALHHPGPRPDFHNDGGFALGIEVPA